MSLTDAEEIALPIDDVDQVLAPWLCFAVIWVDISEQPDLQVLAEQDTLADGISIGTWFYDSPGKQNMRMGLRVEMRQPVHFVIALAFNVRQYVDQLTTIGRDGSFWVVLGSPPSHLVGSIEMSPATIIEQVVVSRGQGLFITLQEHMIVELRERHGSRGSV